MRSKGSAVSKEVKHIASGSERNIGRKPAPRQALAKLHYCPVVYTTRPAVLFDRQALDFRTQYCGAATYAGLRSGTKSNRRNIVHSRMGSRRATCQGSSRMRGCPAIGWGALASSATEFGPSALCAPGHSPLLLQPHRKSHQRDLCYPLVIPRRCSSQSLSGASLPCRAKKADERRAGGSMSSLEQNHMASALRSVEAALRRRCPMKRSAGLCI